MRFFTLNFFISTKKQLFKWFDKSRKKENTSEIKNYYMFDANNTNFKIL